MEKQKMGEMNKLDLILVAPRGFCAGVDRAIKIVEKALEKYGAPVYVRHEIVHNKFVVKSLEAKGAIFVEELDEIPDHAHVIFSAHGVPKSVPEEAQNRGFEYVDATCPLVSKVHREAEKMDAKGHEILLVGHAGHPEVIGTMGQLPQNKIKLIETVEDAQNIPVNDPDKVAVVTQTTLSVDDTKNILETLRRRFPNLHEPKKGDICYATTNRQEAIKKIAPHVDGMIVIGAPNSSNSKRLVEVAQKYGAKKAILLQRAKDIDWQWFEGLSKIGLSAGASAPEVLVQEVISALHEKFDLTVTEDQVITENITFHLPRSLVVDKDAA
jgi:4-hydroxy-3-methylbut-2-enyl diphosphate reductase